MTLRALLGVIERDRNVSKGVVTTTSTFAPGIQNEMKGYLPYRLELRDGKQLREWLKSIANPSHISTASIDRFFLRA